MTSELIVQNREVAVRQQEKIKSSIMVNLSSAELMKFLINQIELATMWRGINKTDDEIKVIALAVGEEIKNRFAYLTKENIATYFKIYKYGKDFNNTICPDGLISCLEKANYVFEQNNNKAIINTQLPPKRAGELTREEKIEIIQSGFKQWKRYGAVDDLNGAIWNCLQSFPLKFRQTREQQKQAIRKAKEDCEDYFYFKYHFKFRRKEQVGRDRQFIRTQEYRRMLKSRFREYWLRDFYEQTKWNKETQE